MCVKDDLTDVTVAPWEVTQPANGQVGTLVPPTLHSMLEPS